MAGYDYSKFRDKLRDEFERGQSSGAEMMFIKDRAAVRILPWLDGKDEERLYREAPVHFGFTKAPVNCPQSASGYCPICDAVRIAKASGDPDEEKWAQSVEARRRFLFNVVNMDVAEEARKVQVLSAPFSLKQEILSLYTDPEYEQAIFLEGRDLILTRTGTGLNTEYKAKIKMSATPFDDTLLDQVFDLDNYVKVEDVEMLRNYLGSRNPETREEAPAARAATPPARSRGPVDLNKRTAPAAEEKPFPDEEIDPVTGQPFAEAAPPPPPARRAAARPAAAAPPARVAAPAARPGARRGR
jgi:hypothetical protein